MVEDVEPEDDGVGLPVELLDPVERLDAAVLALGIDHHDDGRPRVRRVIRGGGQHLDRLRLHALERIAQLRPAPGHGLPGLQRGRYGTVRRASTLQELAELDDARLVRLDEVIHDFLNGPLAGRALGARLALAHAVRELLDGKERGRHTLPDLRHAAAAALLIQVLHRLDLLRPQDHGGHYTFSAPDTALTLSLFR